MNPMMNQFKIALSFDDVLMVPKYSEIDSRSEIDIGSSLGPLKLSLPIISSPMDTITESIMASSMAFAGGLGIIHRYNTIKDQVIQIRASTADSYYAGAAIGISGDFEERESG